MAVSDGSLPESKIRTEEEISNEIADFLAFGQDGIRETDSLEKAFKRGLNSAYNTLLKGYKPSEIMRGIEKYMDRKK